MRLSNLKDVTPLDLKKNLQILFNVVLGDVKMASAGYLLECGSEENRQKLLLIDGDELGGML